MKRHRKHDKRHDRHAEHLKVRKNRQEQNSGFKCSHCKQWVVINDFIGTANRNHCNICLWSKHVDVKKGDRRAECQAGMQPIGLTFRIEDYQHRGEIMLIHKCKGCPKISINRIAADDIEDKILDVFESSLHMSEDYREEVKSDGIYVANPGDKRTILDQLFGFGRNPYAEGEP